MESLTQLLDKYLHWASRRTAYTNEEVTNMLLDLRNTAQMLETLYSLTQSHESNS